MSDDKAQAVDPGAPAAGGGSNKIVMIASLVNMVATIGVVAVLLLAYQKEKSAPSMEDIVKGQAKGGGHGDAAKAGEHGGGGEHAATAEHGGGEHGGGEHGGGSAEAAVDSGKMMGLDPFAVNLATGAGTNPRYARVSVAMELEQGVPYQEFEVKLPRVRDTVINLLNSKRPVELNTVEGREQLKEEIKKSVNGFMSQSKVKGVYFTSFAISN